MVSAQDRSFDHCSLGFMQQDGDEHWVLPTDNKKVNRRCDIYAFVVRNHDGMLIEARSSCRPGHISPEIAEAMGIREALSWIKNQNERDVVVETDCLVAVQAIIEDYKVHY